MRTGIIVSCTLVVTAIVLYTLTPNTPVILGQWTTIKEGGTVKIIGHNNISLSAVSVGLGRSNPSQLETSNWLSVDYNFLANNTSDTLDMTYKRDFTLGYAVNKLNISGSLHKPIILVRIRDSRNTCSRMLHKKIQAPNPQSSCRINLARTYNDPSYCESLNRKKNPKEVTRCYSAFIATNAESGCKLLPNDIPNGEQIYQTCKNVSP